VSASAAPAVIPALAALMVRTLGATLRVTTRGIDDVVPFWRRGQPVIYVVWHGRLLLMPWINTWLRRNHGARGVTVLTSHSRDGELASAYVRRFGLDVVRGSSSRGGVVALRALVGALRASHDIALVPDGPRGPRHRLQPGAVALAALTGAPVVPVACGVRPARRLSTWDGMLVPAPFARCGVVFGAPVTIARDSDRDIARKDLEQALVDVTLAADRLVSA
jgi:lysophospholipid acyltransferase (LPLAT)-like uncharacterized protein